MAKGAKGKKAAQAAEGYAGNIAKNREFILIGTDDPEAMSIEVFIHDWAHGEPFRQMDIADLHFGCLRDPMGSANSLARHKAACDEFLMHMDQFKPHIVKIEGDIFHFKTPTEAERQMWSWFLSELLKRCKVVLQPGNHDFVTRGISLLSSLQEMCDKGVIPNLYMASTETQYLRITNGHDTWRLYNACCEIPVHAEGLDWADGFMYHGDIAGAIWDNGYDIRTQEGYVEKRIRLPWSKVKWTWLGDIHKRQYMAENANYIGAFLQTKFSEDEDKGFMWSTIHFTKTGKWKSMEHGFTNLVTPKKLITIDVNSDADWPEEWPTDAFIRVRHSSLVTFPPNLPDNIISWKLVGDARAELASAEGEGGEVTVDASSGFLSFEDTDADIKRALEEAGYEFQDAEEVEMVCREYNRVKASLEEA